MYSFYRYLWFDLKPFFISFFVKILYKGSNVRIGKNFRCDTFPRIIIDKNAALSIGDNVEFKRNVEIRVHGRSSIELHDNVKIDRGVRILSNNSSKVKICKNVRIGLYSVLNGGDSIYIGAKSLISGFVYIQTSLHGFRSRDTSIQDQGYEHRSVVLEEDTWLGTHVVILPGVVLGKGVVVGSNAVVNKSVEPFQVVGGIPAKIIKERL